jgi:hypothetical protein
VPFGVPLGVHRNRFPRFRRQQDGDLPALVQPAQQFEVYPDPLVRPVEKHPVAGTCERRGERNRRSDEGRLVTPALSGDLAQSPAVRRVQPRQVPLRLVAAGVGQFPWFDAGLAKLAHRRSQSAQEARPAGRRPEPRAGLPVAEQPREQRLESPLGQRKDRRQRLPFCDRSRHAAEGEHLDAEPRRPVLGEPPLDVRRETARRHHDQRPRSGGGGGHPLHERALEHERIQVANDLQFAIPNDWFPQSPAIPAPGQQTQRGQV